MKVPIDISLREICRMIVAENKTCDEWAEIESDDMYQVGSFSGGYDSDEGEFCFSYFAPDGGEHWFQLSIEQAAQIAVGGEVDLEARTAD